MIIVRFLLLMHNTEERMGTSSCLCGKFKSVCRSAFCFSVFFPSFQRAASESVYLHLNFLHAFSLSSRDAIDTLLTPTLPERRVLRDVAYRHSFELVCLCCHTFLTVLQSDDAIFLFVVRICRTIWELPAV